MDITVKKGATSRILEVFIESAYRTPVTGLVFNSAGLVGYYHRDTAAAATAITLATMTIGTWASGGFIEVDGTNMPGVYQLGMPDAALATGAESVTFQLKGVAGMLSCVNKVQLDDNTAKDIFDRLGAPAGASIAADLVVIDNFVDDLEGRLTSTRAGYLDNLAAGAVALDSTVAKDATVAKAADLANVQSDTDDIQVRAADIQSRLPAALVSGRIDASVGAYQSGQAPLQPTTAGRTLDVTAGGNAGIDWSNVETPGATVTLSATTVQTVVNITGYVASISRSINTKLAELAADITALVKAELGKVRPAILDLQQSILRGKK